MQLVRRHTSGCGFASQSGLSITLFSHLEFLPDSSRSASIHYFPTPLLAPQPGRKACLLVLLAIVRCLKAGSLYQV